MLEAVLVLATVMQRYELALAPGFTLELFPSVTLRPKHGVSMVVRERLASTRNSEALTLPRTAAVT